MPDPLGTLRRTHTCGDLRPGHVGHEAVLLGWVHRIRDMGGLIFVDVRDRYGVTQVVARDDAQVERLKALKTEYVVAVSGLVERRSPDTVNPKIETGEVEVVARDVRVLNEARRPPFQVAEDSPVSEEARLRYRYLDLRRPGRQAAIGLRHRISMALRRYFDEQGFWEIETPILTRSTPEGARDYLVPSRIRPGEFYALPQSPQIFKQLLMIAGMDRYVQIVRCFRDEDLRADRQPEFTQIDLEMAFATPDQVFEVVEGALAAAFREIEVEIDRPFRRMTWAEAMAKYGSDKPDLRFGMEIVELSPVFAGSPFRVFRDAIAAGGVVRGLIVKGGGRASRSELDGLVEQAKALGAGGLIWARFTDEGAVHVSARHVGDEVVRAAFEQAGATRDDLLLLGAGDGLQTSGWLGQLRLQLARRAGVIPADRYALLWVTDFPLFQWNAGERRWDSVNHPFTAPREADRPLLERDPGRVLAQAYDVVLNGWELGGGSIRIHDAPTQARVFELLGLSDEEAKLRFGFFLEALQFGTPPHGGIALGLDRLCALLSGETSIREVIAFPKTATAVDLMCGAPSPVDERQLNELHIRTTLPMPDS